MAPVAVLGLAHPRLESLLAVWARLHREAQEPLRPAPLEVSRLLWALEVFLLAPEALGFAQPSPQLHQGLAAVAPAQLPLLLASRQGRFQAAPLQVLGPDQAAGC